MMHCHQHGSLMSYVKCATFIAIFLLTFDGCISLRGPRNVLVKKVSETQIDISWTPVTYLKVTEYKVTAAPVRTYLSRTEKPIEWTYTDAAKAELLGLQAGTQYNISVVAETVEGPTDPTSITAWTEVGEPDMPMPVEILNVKNGKIVVRLQPGTSTKGPVSVYRVVVFEKYSVMPFNSEQLQSYQEVQESGLPFYIAAELSPEDIDKPFTVGDGRHYGGYLNAKLKSDEEYHIIEGVGSTLNDVTKYSYSEILEAEEHKLSANPTDPVSGHSNPTLILLLSVAIAVFGFLLIASFIVYFLLRRHYGKRKRSDEMILRVHGPECEENGFVPSVLQLDDDADLNSFYSQIKDMYWQIPRPQLLIQDTTLGQGTIGPVRVGVVHRRGQEIPVNIQRSQAVALVSDKDRRHLLTELEGMVRLGTHFNLVEFIGGCEEGDSLYVVVEHPLTSLRGLLLTSRHSSEGLVCSFPEVRLLELALGVADGMKHLAQRGVHHGQLSARSVTVVNHFVPKITNFGLARYTPLGKKLDFTRWHSPEAVKTHNHTMKSDVWSYGVLLWEIFTLGGSPYVELKTHEVTPRVMRGLRLPQPKGVSESLYQVMLHCWQTDMDERPSFGDLAEALRDMLSGPENPITFVHTPGYNYERFDPLADEQ